MPLVDKNISIEDLVHIKPLAIKFLAQKGIKCVVCGEPIWGTFEEAAKEKGFSDEEIETMIDELNHL